MLCLVLGAAMTAVITWYRAPMDRLTIEAGIFVALTAIALSATIWLLHRRAAWTA